MPIKLIGRTTDFSGKTLWEILGNLKNFGVGRIVKRNMFERCRYPEPCFYRMLKVETVPIEEGQERKVRAYVEKVFRGRRYPKVVEIFGTSYKSDYRLVPINEEKALWDQVEACKRQPRLLPQTIPFPPLLEYLLKEDSKSCSEAPKLKLKIRRGRDQFYRVAQDGETPTVIPDQSLQPRL